MLLFCDVFLQGRSVVNRPLIDVLKTNTHWHCRSLWSLLARVLVFFCFLRLVVLLYCV